MARKADLDNMAEGMLAAAVTGDRLTLHGRHGIAWAIYEEAAEYPEDSRAIEGR